MEYSSFSSGTERAVRTWQVSLIIIIIKTYFLFLHNIWIVELSCQEKMINCIGLIFHYKLAIVLLLI